MERRIVEFVEVLRHNGLKVSVSETGDALSATHALGLEDPELFRAALKATLVKHAQQLDTFDRAFALFFTGSLRTLAALEQSLVARIREEGLLEGDELKMLSLTLENLAGQLAPLTHAMLSGDRGQLASLFRQASLQLDYSRVQNALQTGFFSRRLAGGIGAGRARSDIATIEAELNARGVSAAGVEVVATQLREALETVERAARDEAQREIQARLKPTRPLSEKPLAQLTGIELDVARRSVKALAERLKSRLRRREKSRRKGQLNPRRTLRRNLGAGGVPMVPVFRSRRPFRPEVMVLCDVSDSVRSTSKLMLLFMYTLQSLFARVRSFIFVSELGEVTKHFKNAEPEAALDTAISGDVISLSSNSNYGRAFATFARDHLGGVTRRTTVFIIGDGRNNHNEANVWALEELRRKAKRVVWLCTEPRQNWGFGDSEMLRYERKVAAVLTVQTAADLERLAEQLALIR